MSRARRAWAWIQSHPLAADTALAVALLGAALVRTAARAGATGVAATFAAAGARLRRGDLV